MNNKQIQSLVTVLGVEKTAFRLLEADAVGVDDESFLQHHHEALPAEALLRWLAKQPPDGAVSRPYARIVPRLVDRLAAGIDGLGIMRLPADVASVADADVRDDIIERLLARMDAWRWMRVAAVASSCSSIFDRVRARELGIVNDRTYPPFEITGGESVPLLTPRLFAHRRDDATLRLQLRALAKDAATRAYTVWLLVETDLLTDVGSPDEVIGDVPLLHQVAPNDLACTRFLSKAISHWPHDVGYAWRAQRILRAAANGVPWGILWWEAPDTIGDIVALESLEMPSPAPWAFEVVSRTKEPARAWPILFALLDRLPTTLDEQGLSAGLGYAELMGLPHASTRVELALRALHPQSCIGWFLQSALPHDADDDFDRRYVDAARRLKIDSITIAKRLTELPLNRERARRIVTLTIESGAFWSLPDCVRIAQAAGPLDHEVPLPDWPGSDALTAFRALAGERASSAIERRVRELLAGKQVHRVLSWLELASELRTDNVLSSLRDLVQSHGVSALAELSSDAPWLVSRDDVRERASAVDDRAWGNIATIPTWLTDELRSGAARARDGDVAARLLDRIEELGAARRDVLTAAFARGPSGVPARWWASKLESRTLWLEVGVELMVRGLAGTPDELRSLLFAAISPARLERIGTILHEVLADALIRRAATHLEERDEPAAERALAALAHLAAPSRLRKNVVALRGKTTNEEVLTLIDVNAGLLHRSAKNESVDFDPLLEALDVYSGRSGSS